MSSNDKIHDLHDFMLQVTHEMAAEYDRIQKRATEDPGTAGDQGEENWKELLEDWLPPKYRVVTKGRIIGAEGGASGQVDVLVLKDSYPEKLLNKKVYLAAGVAAAFECKTTLKAAHIEQAVKTSAEIKSLYPARKGTPYQELHSSIIFGLLAHSHVWKGPHSKPEENISRALREADEQHVQHPRDSLDILCVADLASWTASKMAWTGTFPGREGLSAAFGPCGSAICSYNGQKTSNPNGNTFTPIGRFIAYLSRRIAWEDPSLRSLAAYFRAVNLGEDGGGEYRTWDTGIYSDEVRFKIMAEGGLRENTFDWDEWNYIYF